MPGTARIIVRRRMHKNPNTLKWEPLDNGFGHVYSVDLIIGGMQACLMNGEYPDYRSAFNRDEAVACAFEWASRLDVLGIVASVSERDDEEPE